LLTLSHGNAQCCPLGTLTFSHERQSALMSKITNDGLTGLA